MTAMKARELLTERKLSSAGERSHVGLERHGAEGEGGHTDTHAHADIHRHTQSQTQIYYQVGNFRIEMN